MYPHVRRVAHKVQYRHGKPTHGESHPASRTIQLRDDEPTIRRGTRRFRHDDFDRKLYVDHILRVKYAQFTREGAMLEAIDYPLRDFLEQRAPMPSLPKKMIKPKDIIPWQTSRQAGQAPESIRNDPRAMEDWRRYAEQNCFEVTDKRDRATVLLLKDIDYYRKETLRVTGRRSIAEVQYLEYDAVDRSMDHLLMGLEVVVANRGTTYDAAYFNVWLSFLYETYNSYLWCGGQVATTANPRLQLIQHFKELASSAKIVLKELESEKYNALADVIRDYVRDKEREAANSRWDLYSQAPLTNGLAMLDALYLHMYLGVRLWNDDCCVGNVLHAYNLLRCKGILKKPIPILEKLCDLLHNAVFLGQRPTTNFRSALYRFQGGKTGSKRTADPYSGAESGRSHFIAAPARLAWLGAEDSRIKPEELSKVFMAHLDLFRLQPMLSRCDKDAFGPRWAKKQKTNSEKVWGPGPAYGSDKDFDQEDWTTHEGRNTIRKINHELRGEINLLDEDSFPLVRINSFAVYSLFRNIHDRLWTENRHRYTSLQTLDHADAGALFERLRAIRGGAMIIGAMMDQVDGTGKASLKLRDNQIRYKLGEEPVVMMESVANAILGATQGKDQAKQYLWKHM